MNLVGKYYVGLVLIFIGIVIVNLDKERLGITTPNLLEENSNLETQKSETQISDSQISENQISENQISETQNL